MTYLFYILDTENLLKSKPVLPDGYEYNIWKPTLSEVVPSGIPIIPFAIWWGMHQMKIFKNRDYHILLFRHMDTLIHRSCVFPRYFRFPFMGKNDLQVGDTWTRPGYRGQGLATFAIHKIVEKLRRADRAFWYVVQEDNTSSIRVVEKAGFKLIGKGVKTKRMGLSLFGSYIIKENLVNRFEI